MRSRSFSAYYEAYSGRMCVGGRLVTMVSRATAAAVLLALFAGSSAAQTPELRPDLSGVWQGPYVPDMARTGRNQVGEPALPLHERH